MRVHVLLADSAQADPSGKVHALGIGWTVTSSPTPPAALIAMVWVDWNESNQKFNLVGSLVDGDGNLIEVEGPDGRGPITFGGELEAGRPRGYRRERPRCCPWSSTSLREFNWRQAHDTSGASRLTRNPTRPSA